MSKNGRSTGHCMGGVSPLSPGKTCFLATLIDKPFFYKKSEPGSRNWHLNAKKKAKMPKNHPKFCIFPAFPGFCPKAMDPTTISWPMPADQEKQGKTGFPKYLTLFRGVTPLGPGKPQFLRRFHCILFFRKNSRWDAGLATECQGINKKY